MTWLGLVIGNSRFHWSLFRADDLLLRWDTPPLLDRATAAATEQQISPQRFGKSWVIDYPNSAIGVEAPHPELWAASVVETAMAGLRTYAKAHCGRNGSTFRWMVSTALLGIDRALSLLGAGQVYGLAGSGGRLRHLL